MPLRKRDVCRGNEWLRRRPFHQASADVPRMQPVPTPRFGGTGATGATMEGPPAGQPFPNGPVELAANLGRGAGPSDGGPVPHEIDGFPLELGKTNRLGTVAMQPGNAIGVAWHGDTVRFGCTGTPIPPSRAAPTYAGWVNVTSSGLRTSVLAGDHGFEP